MKRKVLAMMLVMGMLGGLLSGCGAQGGQDAAATDIEAQEGDTSAAAQTADGVKTLDLYIDFSWYTGDTWEGIIPEEITKATGVAFNVTRSVDDSQLGLMIASGELPDVIFTTDENMDRLCDSKMSYSYNELIEQYGLDWQPDEERIGIARTHNVDPEDENYYTIVQNYNTAKEWENYEGGIPGIGGVYYRRDIWKELGSPEMNTKEQVMAVMKQVREQYPEMQVLNAGNAVWRLRGVSTWFGITNDFQYAADGSVALQDTLPEFYDFAKFVNEMYRDGYFPEENLALTNEDDALQQAVSGKCFMYEWNVRPTQMDQMNTQLHEVDPDAEWAFLPILDDAPEITKANSGWAGMFISRNCKDPEAAIRIIEYLNSKEGQHLSLWGREGVDYTLDDRGIPQFSEEWKAANQDSTVMVKTYNTNFFCTTEIDELSQYYSGRTEQEMEEHTKNADKIVSYPELDLALPQASSEMGIIFTKIKEARDAERMKLYTAPTAEDFEAAYQEYMALLDKMGVQDLNAYVTESASRLKEEFGF